MDILIRGGRLLSGEPADVLVSDGVIAAVGVIADRPAEVIDASGLHVGPGLVDGHRHVWQSPLRGAGADMTLPDYFGAVLGRALPRYRAQDANLAALLGAAEALDAGVTTVFDWCNVPHVDAVLDAYATAGIRAVVAAADRPGARAVAGRAGLVTGAMAVFAPPGTVADELRFARDLGLFASMHANGGRGGGLDRLDAAGLLGPWLQLVHVNAMTAEDAHRLADTGTGVTVTPVVEATMGHGESPYTRFLAAGGRAGLGTDVVVNAPPDLFEPMRETLRRHRAESGTMAPAGSVLAAATADSAAAIGLGDVAGAVAVGRPADLVLFSGLDHLAGDVTGALVTTLGPADVHTVLVDGRVVKRDGRLVSLDLATLRASAAEVGRRVLR
ncbi:amidohydrolase family protein [Dactylosporangium matsuzakiense]|uniref:Amidohydrolase n=1 Tax=Dactylosporangium matsuzakiense TaxID=53360 RepID=A0A9W6KHL1_9ACTN|nr:amidohydrolase family protein [Dactylosporangium matsuzakiense]UWZ47516.1 amidohydrolase family protein [Dactylosporangium matsuzakiense]GLL01658.1 amidohydrolase [Dactylosporangium matsuzakiense]